MNQVLRRRWSQLASALFVALSISTAHAANRWVIVDEQAAGAAGLGFLSHVEGYERARAAQQGQPATTFQIGGNFTNFLGNVANGDELVIVVHGWKIFNGQNLVRFGFRWNGQTYEGFGAGQNEMAVPNGFNQLQNVSALIEGCWSSRDPDGAAAETALTEKLLVAMGGAGRQNTVTGFTNTCSAGNKGSGGAGGNRDQRKAAAQAIKDNSPAAMKNPPSNRPNTGGQGQPANQQSSMQSFIDAAIGANIITFTIPNAIGAWPPQVQDGYFPPREGAPPGPALLATEEDESVIEEIIVDACEDTCSGQGCGVASTFVVNPDVVAVETVSTSASSSPRAVDLSWILTRADGELLELRRRTTDTPWRTIWQTRATTYVSYHDESVVPGTRYGYALVTGNGTLSLSETWLDVPFISPQILSARAMGTRVLARISLPRSGSSCLELLDLQGRRLKRRLLESPSAGIWEVELEVPSGTASSLLLLRLVQGDRSDVWRFPLIR